MKSSNRLLLIIIVCFLSCVFFVALVMWAKFNPKYSSNLFGHISSTSAVVTKSFAIDNFSALEINGVADVTVKAGKKTSIKITADKDCLDDIAVNLVGQKLSIDMLHRIGRKLNKKVTIDLIISRPLERIVMQGASSLDYNNIIGDELVFMANGASYTHLSGKIHDLQIHVDGASSVDAKDLVADKVVVKVDGAGDVCLSGKTHELQIEVAGASNVNAKGLIADNVEIKAFGATTITVYAKEYLNIHLYGAAHVDYYGQPKNFVPHMSKTASINNMV